MPAPAQQVEKHDGSQNPEWEKIGKSFLFNNLSKRSSYVDYMEFLASSQLWYCFALLTRTAARRGWLPLSIDC
jgi:hypothetical protein